MVIIKISSALFDHLHMQIQTLMRSINFSSIYYQYSSLKYCIPSLVLSIWVLLLYKHTSVETSTAHDASVQLHVSIHPGLFLAVGYT